MQNTNNLPNGIKVASQIKLAVCKTGDKAIHNKSPSSPLEGDVVPSMNSTDGGGAVAEWRCPVMRPSFSPP